MLASMKFITALSKTRKPPNPQANISLGRRSLHHRGWGFSFFVIWFYALKSSMTHENATVSRRSGLGRIFAYVETSALVGRFWRVLAHLSFDNRTCIIEMWGCVWHHLYENIIIPSANPPSPRRLRRSQSPKTSWSEICSRSEICLADSPSVSSDTS